MNLTIGKVIEVPQAWMSKDEALVYFGYEGIEASFQKLLKEVKEHQIYREAYLSPTYKVVIIHIETFTNFLRWREKNKFKRNKEVV